MDRFLFGGRGLSRVFHVSLILSFCLPLYSLCFYQLDAGEQHRGSTSSSIFYLPANNPGQQQPRLGPSSLLEKCCKQEEREGRRRQRERERGGNGERKVESRRKFSVGGESVYASVGDGEGNGKETEWVKEKEKERIHCNCVWNFYELFFFAGSNFR